MYPAAPFVLRCVVRPAHDIPWGNMHAIVCTLDLCSLHREAAEDIVIDGKFFPKGCAVSLALYSMLHDPEVFREPEVFKPERWQTDDPTYVVFCVVLRAMMIDTCIATTNHTESRPCPAWHLALDHAIALATRCVE